MFLVRELLQNRLAQTEAVANDSDSSEYEVKRALFHIYCINSFLQADLVAGNPVVLLEAVMKVVLHHIIVALQDRSKAMLTLASDYSLPEDEYLQVATHAVSLLPLMHKLTIEALQGEGE